MQTNRGIKEFYDACGEIISESESFECDSDDFLVEEIPKAKQSSEFSISSPSNSSISSSNSIKILKQHSFDNINVNKNFKKIDTPDSTEIGQSYEYEYDTGTNSLKNFIVDDEYDVSDEIQNVVKSFNDKDDKICIDDDCSSSSDVIIIEQRKTRKDSPKINKPPIIPHKMQQKSPIIKKTNKPASPKFKINTEYVDSDFSEEFEISSLESPEESNGKKVSYKEKKEKVTKEKRKSKPKSAGKGNIRCFLKSQVEVSGDEDDDDEEEEVMNSSDRRFIVDTQMPGSYSTQEYSQTSDVPTGISLYRVLELEKKQQNKIRGCIPNEKETNQEYSYSGSYYYSDSSDLSLSDES